MTKPRRIQKLEDIGAKALAEYEQAIGQQREHATRVEERDLRDGLRRVADRQGWSITEKKEQLDGHVSTL